MAAKMPESSTEVQYKESQVYKLYHNTAKLAKENRLDYRKSTKSIFLKNTWDHTTGAPASLFGKKKK